MIPVFRHLSVDEDENKEGACNESMEIAVLSMLLVPNMIFLGEVHFRVVHFGSPFQ